MTKDLKACASCCEVFYCCRDHQVEHFKEGGHKLICPGKVTKAPLTFAECAKKAEHYHSENMWLAALPYYSAMLELSARTLGIFHFQIANCLQVMATCYKKLNRLEHAAQIFQRMLVIREVNNDGSEEKNKELFTSMSCLAELYSEMVKFFLNIMLCFNRIKFHFN